MKKLINKPEDVVKEALAGMQAAHSDLISVDIDLQAVEVTKLSLLLKVLEEAPGETIRGLQLRERALSGQDNVLIDPADARRVGPKGRCNSTGKVAGRGAQVFENA